MSEELNAASSTSIQSAMVEEALENNLPAQVAALSQARQEHAAEVAKLEAVLEELKEQYTRGKQEEKQLVVQSNNLVSLLCALEEDGSKKMIRVKQMEKETSQIMKEIQNLKCKLRLKEQDCRDAESKYSEYLKRMDDGKRAIAESEKCSPAMEKLEVAKQRIAKLTETRISLETLNKKLNEQLGCTKSLNEIKREISEMETGVDKNMNAGLLNDLRFKLEERREARQKLETANLILQKKNSALLTRLKRQVSDQREKHGQLTAQIQLVLDKIESTRAALNRISTQLS